MIVKESEGISELKERLTVQSKIVITTHQNPDGDALGSMLALYWFFRNQGFDVTAISPNDYPEFLFWLPGNDIVIDFYKNRKKCEQIINEANFLFLVDYNDTRRAAEMKDSIDAAQCCKVMIDHHPFPQMIVDYSFSFTEVSSTSELIYEFIMAMDGHAWMNKSVAECIYTGIMTDTGCFSYNSSRPRTFEIVADLLNYSIEKDVIYSRIYDSYSAHRMRLLGYCLGQKMQVFPEYNTALISLSLDEQKLYNFVSGDTEGFVNYPLSIKGICFTAMFIENKDKVKISFRSRGSFPVNALSEKYFSGGGHTNAAGGESRLSLDETVKKFVDLLPQYAQQLNENMR
ncbi:MAG: bifunctional oligoribonuclease/PAP phosphatase NrnA [Bacteroidota bacterium]|nr:bifunctional oligoribonuclease/PAP phosphatase NrnA [Bacteroidota bacterium]